jgi:hypothetical protein
MDNRIRRVEVCDRSLAPAAAEVWIAVEPERRTPTTEVRGRLTGPRCAYANTVEVAYPLRPLPRVSEESAGMTMRVPIPEASLWEPESPFLYQGLVELWQDGRKCDHAAIRHGLRQVTLRSDGLRINGRPLKLRGREVERCTEEETRVFRRQGVNLLVAPVRVETAGMWEIADRLGFLILGRLVDEESLASIPALTDHAACLGWLLDAEWLKRPFPSTLQTSANSPLIAIELHSPPLGPLPKNVQFVAGVPDCVAVWGQVGLPLLGKGDRKGGEEIAPPFLGSWE